MATRIISIDRAPGLTLWAAVVAERLGFNHDEALTLGKAVAGLNAQAKGRRLGIFKPHEEHAQKARDKKAGETFLIEVCGRTVPAVNTDDGIRAAIKGKPISPERVERASDITTPSGRPGTPPIPSPGPLPAGGRGRPGPPPHGRHSPPSSASRPRPSTTTLATP